VSERGVKHRRRKPLQEREREREKRERKEREKRERRESRLFALSDLLIFDRLFFNSTLL
jgi:hypothetical protein